MTWVKICGLTSVEEAVTCVEARADAIGLNYWPRSKRHRPPAQLAEIGRAVAGKIERFGVFVDPSVDEVEAAFAAGAIDVAQLHGDEPADFCQRFRGRYVKALRLSGESSVGEMARYDCDRFLVDAPFAGYGGSGTLVDEKLAALAIARGKVILAGGLTAENVAGLIARVAPFGVDVASGVERAPGAKDPDKVLRFVAAAKGVA
jgi:phosphoribosylanthranilate isomerase